MSGDTLSPGRVQEVTCPLCWRRTDRIQSFEAPIVFFVVFYVAWTHERVAGCPCCVRARLWQLFCLSIPMANVFFPIVGPLILLNIFASQRNDHPGIPPEYAAWTHLTPPPAAEPTAQVSKVVRLVVALLVVAAVVVLVFVVMPRLAG